MVRFDPADVLDEETPAAEPRGAALVVAPRRRSRRRAAPSSAPTGQLCEQSFPSWARIGETGGRSGNSAFFAGASLALLDRVAAVEYPFSGAPRQRLALRAASVCAKMARLREDEAALRDAEHLAPSGAPTSPAGRVHRLWRLFATGSARLAAPTPRRAADLIDLPPDIGFEEFADGLRDIVSSAEHPLAAAAGASAAAMKLLEGGSSVDAEIFAMWCADLVMAKKLRWDAPLPLLATAIGHPSLRRGGSGRRVRPGESDWNEAMTGAYALAAADAFALAEELSRRAQILLSVAPKLRAKTAGQVVDLLLSDDVVSPARASPIAPPVACSTNSSRSASRANFQAGRTFGSMDFSVFARSGNRVA